MQTSSSLFSTRNIVLLVLVVSVALISLLMAFHLRHPVSRQGVGFANEEVVIFPIGRDIKSFQLSTAEDQAFTPVNFLNHWTLLLFGFTHCADVCPANLSMLSQIYDSLHQQYPNLQVVLVSLDPERDNKVSLNKYVKSFHADFMGVSGATSALRKLQSDLGIYAIRDEGQGSNYQIQHSPSILLINPQGKWVGQFKYGLSPQKFMETFNKSMTLFNG